MTTKKQILFDPHYAYFLIWGHGMRYKEEILKAIRAHRSFGVVKIVNHDAEDIRKLVKVIYSHDYAPYWHLKEKVEYLLSTPNSVRFIFVQCNDPQVSYIGEGAFRHPESLTVKRLKETIRNRFNPYVRGKRTEHHVIHASDNETQVNKILKYLSFPLGLEYFRKKPNAIIDAPYYMDYFHEFTVKIIEMNSLYCNIATDQNGVFKLKTVPVRESPHCAFVRGDKMPYGQYLESFQGGLLTEDYSPERFQNLQKKLTYPDYGSGLPYIIVQKTEGKRYIILDGVHRASILVGRNVSRVIVAEVP